MKKRGMEIGINTIVYILIGLAVLVVSLIIFSTLTGKSIGAVDFLKNLFKFR